jgi:hypothetical protein
VFHCRHVDCAHRSFIETERKTRKLHLDDNLQARLNTLHALVQEIELVRGDERKCSAAKAACIECDIIFTIRQQLSKIKDVTESAQKQEQDRMEQRIDMTLYSLLDVVDREMKPILQALIKSAHAMNLKAQGSVVEGQSLKENRLKFSYYQALAEQGFLEPGHEKCSWIRGAFDAEALASQMDETALTKLRAAIECVR